MPALHFTARSIAALKPSLDRVDYADDSMTGFCLRVEPTGRKVWFVRYRHLKRLRRQVLGVYPGIDLDRATELARDVLYDARRSVVAPADQQLARQAAPSFDKVADRYLAEWAKPRKKSWDDDARLLRTVFRPAWGSKGITEITRADVRAVLAPVRERAPILSNRAHSCIRKLFNWALGQDLIDLNPALGIEREREAPRDRVLGDDEIRALWTALDATKDGERVIPGPIAAALKVRLLTGQRGKEVFEMKWANVDLDAGWWEMPQGTTKNRLPHRVPLSAPVLALLKEQRKRTRDAAVYVFAGARAKQNRAGVFGTIAELANAARADDAPELLADFTGTDLRRTCATHLGALGFSNETIGRVLNHKPAGVTAQHYNKYQADAEKRTALDRWAERLTGILKNRQERGRVRPFARRG
jgi:integrase